MNHYRIDTPIPFTVRPTEQGADLDISLWLTRALFTELFAAAAEDPEGFAEEMADMHQWALSAQHNGKDSHARHEFDARMERLLDTVADEGRLRLTASGLHQLRDALVAITAPRPVPAQRERRTA